MVKRYYTKKINKITKKQIRSKKTKTTRNKLKRKIKKQTRKLKKGGVNKPSTIERQNALAKLVPSLPINSVCRAFTNVPIEQVAEMSPDDRVKFYNKWRDTEATRRRELRNFKNIYDQIDNMPLERSQVSQVIGTKRNVNTAQPKDMFNSPFKKKARKIVDVDESKAKNLFSVENDIYEEGYEYSIPDKKAIVNEPIQTIVEDNYNYQDINDDELNFLDNDFYNEYEEKK